MSPKQASKTFEKAVENKVQKDLMMRHVMTMTVGTTFPTKTPLIYLEEGLVSPQ